VFTNITKDPLKYHKVTTNFLNNLLTFENYANKIPLFHCIFLSNC